MFGSISNWVSENKPAMPTMPAMPTVNMPNVTIPNVSMPGFLNKNKESPDENPEETGVESNAAETVKVENIEEEGESSAEVPAEGSAGGSEERCATPTTPEDEAAKGTGYNLGAAREMGSNIGSMLFSFGSKATSNVRNATTSLKDVIQKKVWKMSGNNPF